LREIAKWRRNPKMRAIRKEWEKQQRNKEFLMNLFQSVSMIHASEVHLIDLTTILTN